MPELTKKKVVCIGAEYSAWVYIVKNPDFTRLPSSLYLQNMIKAAESRAFPIKYIEFLKSQKHQEIFEIDFYFSLRTDSPSRSQHKILLPIYKFHDKLRERLCFLI